MWRPVLIAFLLTSAFCESNPWDWSSVDQVCEEAINDGAFPGCVALVADKSRGVLLSRAYGNFTYGDPTPANGDNPPMTMETLFDMASCSKVFATTTAVAQFYQRGELLLDTRIADILGESYSQQGKGPITVLNCLLHNAAYPPDPDPNYWYPAFGCPQTTQPLPAEDWSCQNRIYLGLMNQTLQESLLPIGSSYVYSDLSFITLSYVVGTLSHQLGYTNNSDLIPGCDQEGPGFVICHFEAYVRLHVVAPLKLNNSGYLPPQSLWGMAAPTEDDTVYLHKQIQGQVSDGNAYAQGGVAGHAGFFTTALDAYVFLKRLIDATDNDNYLNRTTVDLFTKEYNHSQSSRALGWNTNDPTVNDMGWNCSCGSMSPRTYMHIGYTGTEMCTDPDRQLMVIFLTNRVYPSALNIKIRRVRQLFHDAVVKVYDQHTQYAPEHFAASQQVPKPPAHHAPQPGSKL